MRPDGVNQKPTVFLAFQLKKGLICFSKAPLIFFLLAITCESLPDLSQSTLQSLQIPDLTEKADI